MISPIECEILISLEDFFTYLDDTPATKTIFMIPDEIPIALDIENRDRAELIAWVKDIWEEGTIVILVP